MKSKEHNPELGLLYGTLLGDGCLSLLKKHYFISIAGSIKDDYPFFSQIIVPLLEKMINRKVSIKTRIKQRQLHILISDKNLFGYLNKLGFPIGEKGNLLSIPSCFKQKDLKYITQGYFATDGCLVLTPNPKKLYPRIEFSSISKRLLEQTLKYLKSLGMDGNIYVSHRYKSKNLQTLYRIQCNGRRNLLLFREKVGFVNPKHTHKFEDYNKNAGSGS